jgi:hypothetical protein
MNEDEWLSSTNVLELLSHAFNKCSERKFRLFCLECCRRIAHLLTDPRSREALEFLERNVDPGVIGRKGIVAVRKSARSAANFNPYGDQREPGRTARYASGLASCCPLIALDPAPFYSAQWCSMTAATALWWSEATPDTMTVIDHSDPRMSMIHAQHSSLLRDIVGNPFRPVKVDPAWLAANESAASRIAQSMYDENVFDRLPILADALEDAGCADGAILSHLRGPGPHVRGCWVIDLVLGRT